MSIERNERPECVDPAVGWKLLDYTLRLLPPDADEEFEVHLLQCETCFEDFAAVLRTAVYLENFLEHSPERVPAPLRVLRRRRFRRRGLAILLLAAVLLGAFLIGLLLGASLGKDPGADESARSSRLQTAGAAGAASREISGTPCPFPSESPFAWALRNPLSISPSTIIRAFSSGVTPTV